MHARNQEFLHASRVTTPRIWTGLLLNESYKVGSLIEQGATTELYDGTEVSTGEPVALKILLPQLAEDAKTRTLFLDEARALRRLLQPGLLRYRSCARDPQSDLIYIVTDVVGMRLSSRLANRKLGEQDIVSLTRRLALALGAAHAAGVIHRNLRPHAIALPQGQLSEATITDFNLIKTAHLGLSSAFDDAMVDHDYCAPEQLSSSGEVGVIGPWTDVYSLALVVLSTLGGKQSDAERKARPDLSLLPRKLQPLFERMLERKCARRLQSMDEVVKQLDLAPGAAPLRSLLNRARSVSIPRFHRGAVHKPLVPTPQPVATPPARLAPPVAAPLAKAMKTLAAPAQKAPVAASVRAPLPPLPESLQPARTAPLGKFHEARGSIGAGGMARRGAVALSALLLAAAPWIIQTSLPSGPADASTVPPAAQVQTASATKAQANSKAAAALPRGRVYGSDNTNSRFTLRIHRPTRLTVHARGTRLLFSRVVQPGDLYRAPSVAATVSTEDAGAVEVLFNGTSAGFVGEGRTPVQRAPLRQFASVAPPPATSSTQTGNAPLLAEEPTATAKPTLTPDKAEAVSRGIAATEEAAPQTEPAQATVQAGAPTVVTDAGAAPGTADQAIASSAAEPPTQSEPAPPITDQAIATAAAPKPPEPAQETPVPPVAAAAPPVAVVQTPAALAPQQQAVSAPPPAPAEPAVRRPLLQRLLPWRANRQAAPIDQSPAATALIMAPAISKAAADRAKAASDMAKAARETAQQKAARENRAREGAFFNSTLGVTTPY